MVYHVVLFMMDVVVLIVFHLVVGSIGNGHGFTCHIVCVCLWSPGIFIRNKKSQSSLPTLASL